MKKWYQYKRIWIGAGVGVLAVLGIAGVFLIRHHVTLHRDGSVSYVIGGADGPTSVFIAGKLPGTSSEETAGQDRLKKTAQTNSEGHLSTLPLDMTMKAVSFVDGILTLEIDNHSGYTMSYGADYRLQKWENDTWTDMVPQQEYAWNDLAYEIEDLTIHTVTCDLTFFGELPEGRYKLIKSEMEAEFELEAAK